MTCEENRAQRSGRPGVRRFVVLVLCCAAVAGCGEKAADSGRAPGPDAASRAPADANVRKDVYVVRAVVVSLPDAANPASEFQARHEAIPNFVGQDGELGMDTMVMPFPLADGLDLSAFQTGDKVELTFEVDFDAAAQRLLGYRATAVKPLPAETELDFTPLRR